jgi:hypothetical protein
MGRPMPKQMEELLQHINDPEEIRNIQGKWNEYVAANENYELNYPQQFGNLVEANLKFKEQKSIPTPAEQMRIYESLMMEEINDLLEERQVEDKEQVYELEEDKEIEEPDAPGLSEDRMQDFKLTFGDMEYIEPENENAPSKSPGNDIDKSQELNVVWLKDYREQQQQAKEAKKEKEPLPQQSYDYQLTFGNLDDIEKDDIEPEEPEIDER